MKHCMYYIRQLCVQLIAKAYRYAAIVNQLFINLDKQNKHYFVHTFSVIFFLTSCLLRMI